MINGMIVSSMADLAEMAYLRYGEVGPDGLRGAAISGLLSDNANKGEKKNWPDARLTPFIQNWRVVAHRPNTASGFSATTFERINPQAGQSRYVLAARG